jgi:hypothetical protein
MASLKVVYNLRLQHEALLIKKLRQGTNGGNDKSVLVVPPNACIEGLQCHSGGVFHPGAT